MGDKHHSRNSTRQAPVTTDCIVSALARARNTLQLSLPHHRRVLAVEPNRLE